MHTITHSVIRLAHARMPKVITVRNMRMLKWGSVLAGSTSVGVMLILKDNHIVSTAVSAGVYEISRMAKEMIEPLVQALENLTEASEHAEEVAHTTIEGIETAVENEL